MSRRSRAPFLVAVAITRLAFAEPTENVEQAKTYFNAGAQAFAAGRFDAAVQAFEESYRLAPRPAILFSIAQAERRQYFLDKRIDGLRRAVAHYRQYVEADAKGSRRADAAQALSELEPILARLDVAGAPSPPPAADATPQTRLMVASQTKDAEVWLDGKKASELPLIEEVSPGKHRVRVGASGYFDEEREVVAVKGSLVAVDIPLRERPALLAFWVPDGSEIAVDGRPQGRAPLAALELPPGRHLVAVTRTGHQPHVEELELQRGETRTLKTGLAVTGQRVGSYWVLGAAGASLVAGGVLAGLSLRQQSAAKDVLAARATGNIAPADLERYAADRDARDRFRTASVATLGGGVALGALGALLYAFDQPAARGVTRDERPRPRPDSASPQAPDVAAAPLLAPGMVGAALGGRF